MRERNFWLKLEGEPQRLGFYTTRFVEARNSEAAEATAVQVVREDPKLQRTLNDRSDPPMIFAEEVSEVVERDPEYPNTGYTFFPEENDA